MQDWQSYVEQLGRRARAASRQLVGLSDATKSAALRQIASAIRDKGADLIIANQRDVEAATAAGMASALVERLKLNEKRIHSMGVGVEQIAGQIDPVGQVIEGYVRPNGLHAD